MSQLATVRVPPATGRVECAAGARALTLRTNIVWNLTGHGLYAACQWGMLAVLAKLGDPEMVGLFALGLAITAPVFMFTNLHLQAVQRTDARRQYLIGDYLGLRLIATALALLIIIGIVLVAGYRGETALVILAIGLAKAVESISNVLYGFFQQHERMDLLARSLIIKGVLSLGAMSGGVILLGGVLGGVVALVAAWTVALFCYDLRRAGDVGRLAPRLSRRASGAWDLVVTELRPRWTPATLISLTRLALPLGVATLLTSLTVNLPRLVIERDLGTRELGIFAAMAYLMVAADTVSMALGQSASPRLAAHYATGERTAYRALLLKLTGLAAVGGGLGVLIVLVGGRQVLTLLYTAEYGGHAHVFRWLMVAVGIGFVATILSYGVMAAQYYAVQAPLAGVVLLVTAGACVLLIPRYGLTGAALALVAAATVNLAGNAATLARALVTIDAARRVPLAFPSINDQGRQLVRGETHGD